MHNQYQFNLFIRLIWLNKVKIYCFYLLLESPIPLDPNDSFYNKVFEYTLPPDLAYRYIPPGIQFYISYK